MMSRRMVEEVLVHSSARSRTHDELTSMTVPAAAALALPGVVVRAEGPVLRCPFPAPSTSMAACRARVKGRVCHRALPYTYF